MCKIKNALALVITLFLSLTTVSTFAATWDKFAIKEVKVVDGNTLKVSFTKDLLEDTSMFEFSLNPKSDDTKEIALTGITLSGPAELTMKTMETLANNEEYNIVVVFASDKKGEIIENWVDGIITFKVPANFSSPTSSTWIIDETASSTDNTSPTDETIAPADWAVTAMDSAPAVDANAAPATDTNATPATDAAPVTEWISLENAAATANPTDVKTWPAETMIVIIAMLLGLVLMYVRRRA